MVPDITSSFANSVVLSSLAFLILTWLMFHLAALFLFEGVEEKIRENCLNL